MPLHSSLGNRARLHLEKKNKNKKIKVVIKLFKSGNKASQHFACSFSTHHPSSVAIFEMVIPWFLVLEGAQHTLFLKIVFVLIFLEAILKTETKPFPLLCLAQSSLMEEKKWEFLQKVVRKMSNCCELGQKIAVEGNNIIPKD